MQSVVGNLPDEQSIFSFVCRGLCDLPGVANPSFAAVAGALASPSRVRFPLQIGRSNWGELTVEVMDPATFAPYEPYLQNFCFMLAVIIEERHQRRLNEQHSAELERRVAERTANLEAASQALAASRQEALNLMQEAVAARERAEQTAAALQREIAERKRAGEENQRLQDQLTQAQKMESVGRLAGGVAHDFNNMLSVILTNAELALQQVRPEQPLYAELQDILATTRRSAGLTRQLLAFARKQTVAPKVLDLNQTVEGMLSMLRRLIGEDIDLVWKPGAEWPVKVDPAQIDQLLANLAVNARDAIAGVGRIAIETGKAVVDAADCLEHPDSVPGEYMRLAVSDNGCGMSKETLAHIFEPFFTTKDVGKGTGLGLATVYGIVRQNHGFVTVCSEPGKGSTFSIYLPRHVGMPGQGPTEAPPEALPGGRETVLLVEDEPALLRAGKSVLERLGYTVLAAGTPGEAILLAEQNAGGIDLLMTDVVMPEMNGRELAQRLLARYPKLKRLYMSGYAANVIAHHGVLDDGVNFIQKPFALKDLADKLRATLSGR
jgi:signal transduction histidine kinase